MQPMDTYRAHDGLDYANKTQLRRTSSRTKLKKAKRWAHLRQEVANESSASTYMRLQYSETT